jgi:hypothetical protein
LDQYGSDSEDDSDQETDKAYQTTGFENVTSESLRVRAFAWPLKWIFITFLNLKGKNYEKLHRVERLKIEKDFNNSEKPSPYVELDKNKSSGENFSKVLQDGTKVDTDINSKFPHGKPNKLSSPTSETVFYTLSSVFAYDCKLLPSITSLCVNFLSCII